MRTTVALSPVTRDRILALKRTWRLSSVDETLARLLDGPALGARALFEQRQVKVEKVLHLHKIRELVAFGSRARGDARPDSDLDLACSFPRDKDLFDLEHARADLEAAFGVPVQLIPSDGMPKRLKERVEREGVRLAA